MNDVIDILQVMGYNDLRTTGAEEWRPLTEVNGAYGTTDDTHILTPATNQEYTRLVDVETGQLVAYVRKGS